jgi:hypothetical protein
MRSPPVRETALQLGRALEERRSDPARMQLDRRRNFRLDLDAVGLGALVRNQVAAIVGLFARVFVVEVLVFQYLPGLGRYTPGATGSAMTGDTTRDSSIHLLSAPVGGELLGVYTAAAVLIGLAVTNRRDVT